MEKKVMELWKEQDIEKKYVEKNKGAKRTSPS